MHDALTDGPAPSVSASELPLRPLQPRWLALFEILLVSGIPTQVLIAAVLLVVAGMSPRNDGEVSLRFFATLSLIDTVLVVGLVRLFLHATGERLRDVVVGHRRVAREAVLGLAFVPAVLVGMAAVVLALRAVFPWMQNVPVNPFLALMDDPASAAVFIVVVVLAGGVREELQRAFVLHRFEQRLGGVRLGLILFSVVFGALHLDQGRDVAIAVGVLGLIWGVLYIRRRSAVLAMVNHAGFNAMQVLQSVAARSIGA